MLTFQNWYANICKSLRHAPIAQLDRVTDYESVGRGFESLSAYQKTRCPFGYLVFCLYRKGLEPLNARVQWTLARRVGPRRHLASCQRQIGNESLSAYQKPRYPFGCQGFCFVRKELEDLNETVRWTVSRRAGHRVPFGVFRFPEPISTSNFLNLIFMKRIPLVGVRVYSSLCIHFIKLKCRKESDFCA